MCSFGDREWSNVYHVDIGVETDIDPAVIAAVANFYQTQMLTPFVIERIIRRPVDTADAFIESVYALAGANSLSGSYALPLFNTLLCLLESGPGRPGRKYLRGFLKAADIVSSSNAINGSRVGEVNTAFDLVLNALSDASMSFVEGSTDSPVVSATFPTVLQMRQQHRKRRNPA